MLVIATDVDHASSATAPTTSAPLGRVTAGEMRAIAADGQFASGSMGPKVEAAVRFVEQGGDRAVITSLQHDRDAVHGRAGTVIENTEET